MYRQASLFDYQPTPGHDPVGLRPIVYDFGPDKTYQPPPPPPTLPPHSIKVTPEMADNDCLIIREFEKFPHEVKYGKFRLTFRQPTSLRKNRRRMTAEKTTWDVRLFASQQGYFCYTFASKTGYPFDSSQLAKLYTIIPVTNDDAEMVEKVRKLANRIHPNAWEDLKEKLLADPEKYLGCYGYTVTSITGKFPDYVLEAVRKAFEEKSDYSHDAGGYYRKKNTGRDLKVECKLGEDGIFRAWFSSEYPGCANGDYWLLINPTTAAFKERD